MHLFDRDLLIASHGNERGDFELEISHKRIVALRKPLLVRPPRAKECSGA